LSKSIEIQPTGPLHATIRPPGSKSLTNRALICAALAEGTSTLEGALDSEDTQVMVESLGRLGIRVEVDAAAQRMIVSGIAGNIPAQTANLFIGNSGTSVRFLTALAALGRGEYRLDGVPRMRERPIAPLADAMNQLGADVQCGGGCPPVTVRADGLPGGNATMRGDLSSQFLSALLMVAPFAAEGVQVEIDGPLVSKPYVKMTLDVMRAFGIDVPAGDLKRFDVAARQCYGAISYAVEPDASAASYFFAAAAIAGGQAVVQGLSRDSLQGDVAFCDCLERMGCEVRYGNEDITVVGSRPVGSLVGIDVDMNAISDTVQTLCAVALYAEGPTCITGVEHIRHKETDRIAALAIELRKFGARVDERPDGLTITPASLHGATIDTYDDHRMAMSMALVGLRTAGVTINDPGCTAKTYPAFFEDLASVCAK
jgi:3-phosphoshikimate 1-carboxyvinyltransferase